MGLHTYSVEAKNQAANIQVKDVTTQKVQSWIILS